jgi:hypothetical protein
MRHQMTRFTAIGAVAALCVLLSGAPALAAAPLGACCFPNGTCRDLISVQCDDANAEFIGAGTSCQQIDCAAPVGAPVLSITGLVAALGALAALGLYRLGSRRR